MKRWMKRILLEQIELFVGSGLNVWRKRAIEPPKLTGCVRDELHDAKSLVLRRQWAELSSADGCFDLVDDVRAAPTR